MSPNLNQLFRVHTITRVVARRGYPARARMPTTEETNPVEVKRPRLTMDATPDTLDPPRANDRVIDQTLGDDAEHPMRELFESWGLPDRFVQGVSPSWRCKLVPLARTEDELREHAVRGVPTLASPEYARGVFDAMSKSGGGEDSSGDDAAPTRRDAVSWACDSPWSSFPRPKVAMVGGWGAPGSHLLSDRYMRMVRSFAEVVDGDEPLNLQMFHREDTAVPVLPTHLTWPLPEFFDNDRSGGDDETRTMATTETPGPSAETTAMDADGNKTALPAQGAFYKPGGVGVPLDMATRLSAAGALTWWHLDDCGEFVFQVGLPIDRDAAPRAGTNPMRRKDGGELLGPTGKPVCKLFVFASREDYEWIAQDGVMNQTMKQTALDLFDTPTHYLPSELELTEPYSSAPLESEKGAKFEAGVTGGGVSGGDTRRTRAKLPTFWVAPLECGGCPLLSPPNWIHCVLTVRDCVMVEERRLSLAFLDEVLYFQRRMTRWCEPPVQYRFIREDLTDENRCAAHVVVPLLRMLSGTSIAARCRARNSLKTLTSPDAGYATSDKTRATIVDALNDFETWLASDAGAGCRDFIARDTRERAHGTLLRVMRREGEKNVHALGAFDQNSDASDGAPFAAVVHEKGRPRWGPVRGTRDEAAADRKTMRAAVKEGSLDALLKRWRGNLEESRSTRD